MNESTVSHEPDHCDLEKGMMGRRRTAGRTIETAGLLLGRSGQCDISRPDPNRRVFLPVFLFSLFIFNGLLQEAWAVDAAPKVTDREIIESLAELKAGQKSIERGLDAIEKRIDGVDKRIDGLDKRIDGLDKRMDGLDQRMDRLEATMVAGFGLLFTSMIGLVGFVLWDRRTALAPAVRKNRELEEREDRVEKVLKEYAMEEPKLREILKRTGLL